MAAFKTALFKVGGILGILDGSAESLPDDFKVRQSQIHERLREGTAEALARIVREDLKDPRLGFVTITRVETAADQSFPASDPPAWAWGGPTREEALDREIRIRRTR